MVAINSFKRPISCVGYDAMLWQLGINVSEALKSPYSGGSDYKKLSSRIYSSVARGFGPARFTNQNEIKEAVRNVMIVA